jgi:hypothetical protein
MRGTRIGVVFLVLPVFLVLLLQAYLIATVTPAWLLAAPTLI